MGSSSGGTESTASPPPPPPERPSEAALFWRESPRAGGLRAQKRVEGSGAGGECGAAPHPHPHPSHGPATLRGRWGGNGLHIDSSLPLDLPPSYANRNGDRSPPSGRNLCYGNSHLTPRNIPFLENRLFFLPSPFYLELKLIMI